MKRIFHLLFLAAMLNLMGCVAFFMPKKQKVTISTGNREAVVYADNEEIGKGKSFQAKVIKDGTKQIVVQVPEHKDEYHVLLPVSRPIAFWPMIILDIPFFYPLAIDPMIDKGFNYPKYSVFKCENELVKKTENQKYIKLEAVKIDIRNKEKDLNDYYVSYTEDLEKAFARAEKERQTAMKKQEAKDKKKKKGNKLETDDTKIKSDDTEFSANIFKSLKKMGFVDTLNKVFSDNNNTLVLEGVITKGDVFHVAGKNLMGYKKARLSILWKIKNTYGEVLDSIELEEYSGDFIDSYLDDHGKMFADAVDNSYFSLISQPMFLDHLKLVTDFTYKEPELVMPKARKVVKEVGDALDASVIIKKKDGSHGSGFAVSNDGYILTNFHVISGNTPDKQGDIVVILSDGTEIPVDVIRFNRMRDVALLKVDHEFGAAFLIPSEKMFKVHQEIYAAGAPKSIELGQSVSLGLISNERKMNNNMLLQLSININPGNSGGPLFEKSGLLHGIVTSKLVGYATEGVGFAIPAYLVPEYLNLNLK